MTLPERGGGSAKPSRRGHAATRCRSYIDFRRIRMHLRIGPYNAFKNRGGIFELFLVSRERSKKTEAVFLVASRRSGGKSKSPGPQMISICVLTLTRTSLTAEYYSAQVHLNGMERYRQVCRMHRIICAWPHSSSAIFSSIQRCVPAFSASASYASCAACSSE